MKTQIRVSLGEIRGGLIYSHRLSMACLMASVLAAGFSPASAAGMGDEVRGGLRSEQVLSSSSSPVKKAVRNNKSADFKASSSAEIAQDELRLRTLDFSKETKGPSGILRSSVSPLTDPVVRPQLEFALAYEPYRPQGTVDLPGFAPYRLDQMGTKPMYRLDLRWSPWVLETTDFGLFGTGLFMGAGYSQSPVDLKARTGVPIESTVLQTYKWQAGASLSWNKSKTSPWGLRAEVASGEMRVIQSSSSSLANHSAAKPLLAGALMVERRMLNRFAFFFGVDQKFPIGGRVAEIELTPTSYMIGVSGGLN